MVSSFKTLSIIIPVYNEEKYIQEVIRRVIKADTCGLKKEIIIVNDGSTDKTVYQVHQVIKFIKSNPWKSVSKSVRINFVNNLKNEGKGYAIKTGLLKSTGDIVLIQDSDLEYNPVDYPLLLEPFLKFDADVVYGSRFVSNRPRRILYFWHYVTNIILTTFSNMLTNLNLSDMETGYKVFKDNVIRPLGKKLVSKRFGFEPEITALIAKIQNLKIYEVGISYQGRTYAEGKKISMIDGVRAIMEIFKFNLFN
jgi:glycosyltransferase involved in cell wall biosynthesis